MTKVHVKTVTRVSTVCALSKKLTTKLTGSNLQVALAYLVTHFAFRLVS